MEDKFKCTDYFKELWHKHCVYASVVVALLTLAAVKIISYFNIIDWNNIPCNNDEIYFWIFIILFLFIIYFVHEKFFSYFKLPHVSMFDGILLSLFGAALAFLIYLVLGESIQICVAVIILGVTIIFLVVRFCLYCNANNNGPNTDFQDVSLYKLYNGKINRQDNKPIIVNDKPSDIDLFNMDDTINQIYNAICYSTIDTVKIIGINGEWGSGKTTLVKLAINKILDDYKKSYLTSKSRVFDMWSYGSNEALLFSLYDHIFEVYKLHGLSIRNRKNIKVMLSLLGNKFVGNVYNIIANVNNGYSLIENESKRISNILSHQKRRAIIFIDNIDRAENKTVVFLLRLLGTFLKIPGIIFILAYSREELRYSLTGEVANKDLFIDKVVNKEIILPAPNSEARFEIIYKIFNNLLLSYGVKEEELELYNDVITILIDIVTNIRKIVLIINNSFAETFTNDCHNLYLRDLLAINIIKELNLKLWNEIRDNKEYFVTSNLGTKNNSNYLTDATSYFENFEKMYALYIPFLKVVFPVINNYIKGDANLKYIKDDHTEERIHHYKSITSGVYFESYFIFGYSKIDKLNEDVRNFVNIINNNIYEDIERYVINLFDNNSEYVKSFYVMLEYFLDDIDAKAYLNLTKILINHYYDFERLSLNLDLSTQSRIEVIIARLISVMNRSEVKVLSEYLSEHPEFLLVIDAIYYWLNAFINDGSFNIVNYPSLDNSIHIFKQLLESSCTRVVDQNINLYDLDYFHIGNIWALFRYFKPHSSGNDLELDTLTNYMNSCLNQETVYRALSDVVHKTTHYGNKITFRYCFNESDFYEYLLDPNKIEALLKSKKPSNKTEKFLNDLFQLYLKYKVFPDGVEKQKFKNYIELEENFHFEFNKEE